MARSDVKRTLGNSPTTTNSREEWERNKMWIRKKQKNISKSKRRRKYEKSGGIA